MAARGAQAAALALHRFGFGPRRNSIAAIASDPRGALLAELERPGAGRLNAQLPSSSEAARAVFQFQAEQRAQKKLEVRAQKLAQAAGGQTAVNCKPEGDETCATPVVAAEAENPPKPGQPHPPPLPQRRILDEASARFDAANGADIGFVERLVWFWSNHFCISADKIPAMAGAYEREAIRPHVLGRFADLLQAVESHPGMLFYLDNVESIGPDSTAGIDRDKGLNENLARETLELHTLGVRSGYTQTDVTNFAKVLTGWTWFAPSEPVHGGEFVFNPIQHEPGAQIVLGKSYAQNGVQQGRAVLADLARHPATAHHIAAELAAHFIADEPPPALVAKLEQTFNASGGDLREIAKTLIAADESWTPQRTKLKPPAEWIVGILRLTDGGPLIPIGLVMGAQAQLGAALWRPPAPNGYSDREAAWIDGVPHRLDLASQFASRLATGAEPVEMLDSALGPLASPQTRDTVLRAESRAQALTLLVMSPEFLRS
jgi:uncharacterized protein (DUF1800 family)